MTVTSPAAVRGIEWVRCSRCTEIVYGKRFARELGVCPGCGLHTRLSAWQRIEQLFDEGCAEPIEASPVVEDPLGFADSRPYTDRLREARLKTELDEAVVCVRGTIEGHPAIAAVMDFRFMGGSLGSGVGERIVTAAETALAERMPFLLVTASGGARMQEGALSLMQMAKTGQALAELDEAGILTVAVVTDPTYGGVAASFATLPDVILAEPGAHIGFAGPRVIKQTIGQELPEGFQTAEFLRAKGLIDVVQPRSALRSTLARLCAFRNPGSTLTPVNRPEPPSELIFQPERLPVRDGWTAVRLARHTDRPTTLDYAGYLLEEFVELHGDRVGGDCPAIVGGIGRLDSRPIVLVGHQKGHDTRERIERNFGMPTPAGYRKAARLMRLAAKLGYPVLTLIDTPGAYPGIEAEENGQAWVIAENLRLMSALPVPVVAVVTGEGGSGGALALGVANRVLALSNAVYSVISPEGCASILWKSRAEAPRAADALRLDARELLRHGIVDGVIPEPGEGAHTDPVRSARLLGAVVTEAFQELAIHDPRKLVAQRRQRFRQFGSAPR
ncbi:acetyl-CoA carboxylase carboxyltransferase subunit alpha [Streptosporangium sp. NBC_01810]|uniref:acetyl-CoA carboxylase carboxyltransferase subunit alpha n=1 Tax=Streptosporangium sp. NBC_01810 TaxID=2975951 RepID=UPI002DD89F16|nr:acetyl-CoA carboxylase carboxyltransferase subunit alpha [Streptosporangium sp. NBC_01810]WSA25671.1 acetyl-CoA carboxylase carboxyltransferase subunit alpha [Streptosporangium sp. NBC_01810]